jgi:hypothetical protein
MAFANVLKQSISDLLVRELNQIEEELGGLCGCKRTRIAELQVRRQAIFNRLRELGVDPDLVSSL